MRIFTFSFAAGQEELLPDMTVVIDCRGLPDPEGFGVGPDGRDFAVQNYVCNNPVAELLLARAYDAAANRHMNIAFGCYAGKNRSVAMAERFADRFVTSDPVLEHLGLELWDNGEWEVVTGEVGL